MYTRTRIAVGVLVLGICSPLAAQSVTSPPGYDWKDAPHTSQHFGAYPDARFQFLDGSLTTPAMTLRQIHLRLDSVRNVTNSARSWEKVILLAAPCDYRRHTKILDQNASGPRQLVFLGKVTWPRVTTQPLPTAPIPQWGGSSSSYRFPLRSPYLKPKNQDLLLDFHFGGGSLEFSGGWKGQLSYAFDGIDELDRLRGATGFGSACGKVATQVEFLAFRKEAADKKRAGMLEGSLTTEGLRPAAPVLQSMGFGINYQVAQSCPTTYLRKVLFTALMQADGSGRASRLVARVPHRRELAEMLFVAQAWYFDSKGRLQVTPATQSSVPPPPGPYGFDRVFYMALSPTAEQGVFLDHQSQPVFRYS